MLYIYMYFCTTKISSVIPCKPKASTLLCIQPKMKYMYQNAHKPTPARTKLQFLQKYNFLKLVASIVPYIHVFPCIRITKTNNVIPFAIWGAPTICNIHYNGKRQEHSMPASILLTRRHAVFPLGTSNIYRHVINIPHTYHQRGSFSLFLVLFLFFG